MIAVAMLLAATASAAPQRASSAPPTRQWRVTLAESDGVEIVFYATVRFRTPATWEMYSREGAARSQVSWFKWMLGGLLGKRPPHGAFIVVTNGTAAADSEGLTLRGQLESVFPGQRWVTGRWQDDRWRVELRRGSETGAVSGTMEAVPATSTPPVRNYTSLAADVRRAIADTIYDPSLPARPAFRTFLDAVTSAFGRARDDLDAIVAFEAARSRLGMTHLRMVRNPPMAATSIDAMLAGRPNVNPDSLVQFNLPAPGIAWLKVSAWDRVTAPVDRAFARMATAGVTTLILDIRGNPGGDATSFAPAAHVMGRAVTLGVILGRPWYAAHQKPPTPDELVRLPVVASDAPPRDILRQLEDVGAVPGRVEPRTPQFTGEIYLMIDGRTASASEPLAHLLKVNRRATLVGERTAGAMLLALPQPLSDGFVVTVPRADYYTADGTRLEGRGVEPDVRTPAGEAFVAVAKRIRQTKPHPGNLLLGGVYMSLKRWDESERAYRTALTLATTDAQRAVIERQLQALASARAAAR
jgi:hypothetical protein